MFSIDEDGYVKAFTDYEGDVAIYLRNNNNFIEKEAYSRKKIHTFRKKPKDGLVNLIFFFKEKDREALIYETSQYLYELKCNMLQKLSVEEIAESDNYKITYFNQKSDITFITFNGTKTTKKTVPFGINFIIKNGWNLISVAQDNDTQYQELKLEAFRKIINPVIAQKDVYAYGVSLGGYCALYYGGSINATIIAASPRNSAHPSINLARFKNISFNHKSFSDIPVTKNKVYITYDPIINTDAKFISDVISPGYPFPEYLPIENGTHMILQSFLKANVLKFYIYSIVSDRYDSNTAKYITAKCKYSQGNYNEAFNILDALVRKSYSF